MAIYVKATNTWVVSDSSSMSQIMSKRSSSKIDSTTMSEHSESLITLADGVTDQAVDFGTVATANALRIESDRAVSVKINGTSVGLPIGSVAAEGGTLQLDATSITSMSITNASGGTANVKISLPGV